MLSLCGNGHQARQKLRRKCVVNHFLELWGDICNKTYNKKECQSTPSFLKLLVINFKDSTWINYSTRDKILIFIFNKQTFISKNTLSLKVWFTLKLLSILIFSEAWKDTIWKSVSSDKFSYLKDIYRLPRSCNLLPHSIMLSTLTGPEMLHFTRSQSYKTALSF